MMTRDCISLFERRGSPPRSSDATPNPSTVRVPSIASTSKIVRKTVIRRIWPCHSARARGCLRGSIPAGDQAAGDDLRLNFGGALEDVEDAGVAQHPTDRIFEGVAVAAMDLQGVIGVRPGDTGGEQLGHAGLDVAAPAPVLFARGEISELTRDHRLRRHQSKLAGNPREGNQLPAELRAPECIGQAELERVLGNTD